MPKRKRGSKQIFFSTTEVADMFGISRQTVWRWVRNGIIRATVRPGRIYISENEIKRLITEGGQ